jgi:hypothetical protein
VNIFYCGSTANLNSLLAGAIHLGRLPEKRLPTNAELSLVRELGRWGREKWGIPVCLGADQGGNKVYALLLGADPDMVLQAIYHLLNRMAEATQWKFYKTREQPNLWIRFGCFGVNRLHLGKVGNLLIRRGLRSGYFDLVNLVRQVKEGNWLGKT